MKNAFPQLPHPPWSVTASSTNEDGNGIGADVEAIGSQFAIPLPRPCMLKRSWQKI